MLKRYLTVAAAATLAVGLSACGSTDPLQRQDAPAPNSEEHSGNLTLELSGTLTGAGASSQESAMDAWRAGFQGIHPETTVTYDPVGSSGGRTQFLEGGLSFAGTDSPLAGEELERASDRCYGAGVLQAPLYISPIAVVYNLPEAPELNLSPGNLAGIFNQEITQWNDPALVAANPEADLPDTRITPANRSDGSGTTESFTEDIPAADLPHTRISPVKRSDGAGTPVTISEGPAAAAGAPWPHQPGDTGPPTGSQSAQGPSGVVQSVQVGQGTTGYADASKAGDL